MKWSVLVAILGLVSISVLSVAVELQKFSLITLIVILFVVLNVGYFIFKSRVEAKHPHQDKEKLEIKTAVKWLFLPLVALSLFPFFGFAMESKGHSFLILVVALFTGLNVAYFLFKDKARVSQLNQNMERASVYENVASAAGYVFWIALAGFILFVVAIISIVFQDH
ncbi:MAG: hypothetical protein H7Z71_09010 [Moraxellaceae bacterium]|nr:hypothetical protein [Pseudobdellovibrionaceae bacterium]